MRGIATPLLQVQVGRFNGGESSGSTPASTTLKVYSGRNEVTHQYSPYALEVFGGTKNWAPAYWGSDERLKKNLKPIKSAITSLAAITGLTYNFKSHEEIMGSGIKGNRAYEVDTTYNEKGEMHIWNEREAKFNYPKGMQYGVSAQAVKEILPELVVYDSAEGLHLVNYQGFIPILIEGVKEQQAVIESMEARIATLETALNKLTGNDSGSSSRTSEEETFSGPPDNPFGMATLEQNLPNPFRNETKINYSLPTTVQNATLYVYNLSGVQIKKLDIQDRGAASTTFQGNEFKAGVYLYTLIADGKEVATKKMILTD